MALLGKEVGLVEDEGCMADPTCRCFYSGDLNHYSEMPMVRSLALKYLGVFGKGTPLSMALTMISIWKRCESPGGLVARTLST